MATLLSAKAQLNTPIPFPRSITHPGPLISSDIDAIGVGSMLPQHQAVAA